MGPGPVERWLCLFAVLLSTTSQRKLFLPKFADGKKVRGKEMELGIWESLMGIKSFGHCGSVTLTFGHGGGELKAYFSPLCLLPHKLFCHWSQLSETAVIEPSSYMNMHDKSFLLCPLSCFFSFFFFFSSRDLSCCIWLALTFEKVLEWKKNKEERGEKKKVVYDNWRTRLAAV